MEKGERKKDDRRIEKEATDSVGLCVTTVSHNSQTDYTQEYNHSGPLGKQPEHDVYQ